MSRRRRTVSSAKTSEAGRSSRRCQMPGTTLPGRLCGRRSSTRSSRSTAIISASLSASRSSTASSRLSTGSSRAGRQVSDVSVEIGGRHVLGERRHVVGSYAGDGPLRDRSEFVPTGGELLLVHAEHLDVVQSRHDLRRHCAEVLADDGDAGGRGAGCDDGEEFVVWVAHVHAPIGGVAIGDPPEAVNGHHVVDPQHRCVASGACDHLAPERVSAVAHLARQLRRKPPVLAVHEERVGWCADRCLGREQRRMSPRLVSIGMRADRQVERETGARRRSDGPELLVTQHLRQRVRAFDQLAPRLCRGRP